MGFLMACSYIYTTNTYLVLICAPPPLLSPCIVPGTLPGLSSKEIKKRQSDRHVCQNTESLEIGWTGLSGGEGTALWKLRISIVYN